MAGPSPHSGTVRTYHVGPWRRWLLWFVLGPMIAGLLILGAAAGWEEGRPFILTAGLVFLIGLPFQLIVDRARVELSPDGVCLRQTGYMLRADWSEIVDLILARGRQGFITREPMAGSGAARLADFRWAGWPAPLYDEERRQLLAERRFIPIEAFAWHLRRGMCEEIVRFAPHLAHVFAAN